jgi:hypothetical protein
MCDAVGGRVVAWLALVLEGRMMLLLLLLLLVLLLVVRRRAVGMDIHDAGTAGMNWLASSGAAFAMAGRDRRSSRVGMGRGGGGESAWAVVIGGGV